MDPVRFASATFVTAWLMLSGGGCGKSDAPSPTAAAEQITFIVRSNVVLSESFVGFGAQMNGWLYCTPNWGPAGVNEENVKDLEAKVIDLAPQHVRVFVETQDDSPQADAQVKGSIIRTIDLAKRAGATVNCTLWHGPHFDQSDSAKRMADMLLDFRRNHGLTNVQYATLQNEPNGFDMDKKKYNRLYTEFDRHLRAAGIRDEIKVIGGDLLGTKQEDWFWNLADNLSTVCDGWSVHMYGDYWENRRLTTRVREIAELAATLPPVAHKPIYVTEFAFRGQREDKEEPGHNDPGTIVSDLPLYGLLCGWRIIDIINNGFVCAVHWDLYDAMYDRDAMRYGLIGGVEKGWPLRPHYFLFKMFTHTAGPGWKSMRVDGAIEAAGDKAIAAAMRGPGGEWTLYAANRDQMVREISMTGIPASTSFRRYVWNADGSGKLSQGVDVSAGSAGRVVITLPAQAVVALTTGKPQF